MARIFYRHYPRCSWDPSEPEAPQPGLTLREWEVAVILCSQAPAIKAALRDWLEAPTDRQRWPTPDRFSSQRAPFVVGELNEPLDALLDLFSKELAAMRQTLDMPIEAFCGLNRNVLLAMHGQRLRVLVWGLGLRRALAEIARLIQPEDTARSA